MSLRSHTSRSQAWTQSTTAWSEVVSHREAASIMDWAVTDDFHTKQGRSTGRLSLGNGKLIIYLKRHWQFPWMRRQLARLWPHEAWTPAVQEWHNLQWAKEQHIRVPEPLAVGQFIGPGSELKSFLAIKELAGMMALHQAIPLAYSIMPAAQFNSWKQQVFLQMAHTARRLHSLHRYHKDLYLCHFYVNTPQTHEVLPGELTLIDFHRLAHHRWFTWRWQVKDLAQLIYSTWGVAGITDDDRDYLFHAYTGNKSLSQSTRWLYQATMLKARRYAHHNGIAVARQEAGKAA